MSDKMISEIWDDAWLKSTHIPDATAAEAVARHVFAEMMEKHLAECHASPVPIGTSNTGPIIACDVKPEPAKGDADWAMEAWNAAYKAYCESPACDDSDAIAAANAIREATERHYRAKFETAMNANGKLIQERDAARAALQASVAQGAEMIASKGRLTKERDAARAECERLKQALEPEKADSRYRTAPPPAAVAGEDELIVAVERGIDGWTHMHWRKQCRDTVLEEIRPLFDAIRRERDKWREGALQEAQLREYQDKEIRRWQQLSSDDYWAWQGDGTDNLESLTCNVRIMPQELLAIVKRSEAAEAVLAELRSAIEWYRGGGLVPWAAIGGSFPDGLLAAYRKNKEQADAKD